MVNGWGYSDTNNNIILYNIGTAADHGIRIL